MSELIQKGGNRDTIRWTLLTSASALTLAAYISSAGPGMAGDSDHPLVWIELGGQFSQQENGETPFAPPFLSTSPFDAASHLDLEKGRATVWDKEAKITFQPEGSDWLLSMGLRYGKSSRAEIRDGHPTTASLSKYHPSHEYHAYQNLAAQSSEGHFILDFQAGRDVGLGRFGSNGSSVVSAGIRIAKFNSRNHVNIKSEPVSATTFGTYNKFYASFTAKRKFTGIGPSLSWDASAIVLGNPSGGSLAFDWGLNAAILFGRQRTDVQFQTSENHFRYYGRKSLVYQSSALPARNKQVTVPNLGGFAGVSWRYPNAKVSIGYRADFFFGAMDGGIDTAHRENVGFYGPFASVSVGIGG